MFVSVRNGLIGAISKAESGSPADPGVPVWLIEGLRWRTCRAGRATAQNNTSAILSPAYLETLALRKA